MDEAGRTSRAPGATLDAVFRAVASGGMLAVAVAAAPLFMIGAFIAEEASDRPASGDLLVLAAAVGFISAVVAIHGLAVNSPRQAAIAASIQGITALLLVAWWVEGDFWADMEFADRSRWFPSAVLALDAIVLAWAVWRLSRPEAGPAA